MNLEGHPIRVVKGLVAECDEDLTFQFSKYFHRPQSVLDEREEFFVTGSAISDAWLSAQVRSLAPGWELALGSLVKDSRGRRWQLPMADLVTDQIDERSFSVLRRIVPPSLWRTAAVFDSGRSYHIYFRKLIRKGEWPRFMGRLLLANLPGQKQIIDSRWVGHRLIGGYGALRWSANSDHHSRAPVQVTFPPI